MPIPKGTILFTFNKVNAASDPSSYYLSFDNYVVQNMHIGLVGSLPGQETVFNIQNLIEDEKGNFSCNLTIASNPMQCIINNPVNGLGGVKDIPAGYFDPYFTLVPKA